MNSGAAGLYLGPCWLRARMRELEALAAARGVALYEGAAQTHGAVLDGRPVGSFDEFEMSILCLTKNTACGEVAW